MSKRRPLFLIAPLALVGLLATAVVPLTAFEAHVINVTAIIDPGPCKDLEVKTMTWWRGHPEFWIFPQTLGADTIDTPAKATAVYAQRLTSARNQLRAQVLTLKFNVSYFHVGRGLVPGQREQMTIAQLVAEADALLKKTPPPSDRKFNDMQLRIVLTNGVGHCLVCG